MNRDEPIGDGDAPTVPWSVEAEQSVLGGLMPDNTAWDRAGGVHLNALAQSTPSASNMGPEGGQRTSTPSKPLRRAPGGLRCPTVRPRNAIREPAEGVHEPPLHGGPVQRSCCGTKPRRSLRVYLQHMKAQPASGRRTSGNFSLVPGDNAPRAVAALCYRPEHVDTPPTTCFRGGLKRVYR